MISITQSCKKIKCCETATNIPTMISQMKKTHTALSESRIKNQLFKELNIRQQLFSKTYKEITSSITAKKYSLQ